jgi:DnaJ family protein C protein 30
MAATDPYKVLGIPHSATDAEIRAAYRHQVQLHHPDHNGGSPESAQRFEQVQEAYALIRKLQQGGSTGARGAASARRASPRPQPPPPPASGPVDPGVEARLAELDRELKRQREAKQQAERNAQRIREDALRQAREATRAEAGGPSDEDLGYVSTDDSFSAIFDDAASEWGKRFSEAKHPSEPKPSAKAKTKTREEPVTERLADLFDGWGARLRGEKQRDED